MRNWTIKQNHTQENEREDKGNYWESKIIHNNFDDWVNNLAVFHYIDEDNDSKNGCENIENG